ncbi:membrane protein [Actinorhabdospora filicis]|uniref:Membrane protein n=1 Tax=Actinorhabdospora filicis TaxID=1785913 RepID=A0A9W6SUH9_9ACTN|nr:EamA family transporter [Actinorhabdospora filicis]GLZ82067.1 membrane protein [Actinorhabdospora filicis]
MTVALPAKAGGVGTAVALTLGSMTLVQSGLAASTLLFDDLGPAGTTWLRLSWAAVILLAVTRPKPWAMSKKDLGGVALLGTASGLMTLLSAAAIDRLPLSAVVAVGFLGPLGIGVFRRAGRLGLLWPPIALAGVVLVTQPWNGSVDPLGLAYAVGNAACWAAYILLTQKVADRLPGLTGLALSMTVAALVTAVAGAGHAVPRLDGRIVLVGLGIALLLPVLPYVMEMLALRRMAVGAFGTLLSLEPALALVIGTVFLSQVPHWWQVAGIGLVSLAAAGAARGGKRT